MQLQDFTPIDRLVRDHAAARLAQWALVAGNDAGQPALRWAELDAVMDRVAATLQREGVQPGQAIVLCGASTPIQAALFLGALRAGVVVAPIAPSVTPPAWTTAASCARCLSSIFITITNINRRKNYQAHNSGLLGSRHGRSHARHIVQ